MHEGLVFVQQKSVKYVSLPAEEPTDGSIVQIRAYVAVVVSAFVKSLDSPFDVRSLDSGSHATPICLSCLQVLADRSDLGRACSLEKGPNPWIWSGIETCIGDHR